MLKLKIQIPVPNEPETLSWSEIFREEGIYKYAGQTNKDLRFVVVKMVKEDVPVTLLIRDKNVLMIIQKESLNSGWEYGRFAQTDETLNISFS